MKNDELRLRLNEIAETIDKQFGTLEKLRFQNIEKSIAPSLLMVMMSLSSAISTLEDIDLELDS